MHTMRDAGAFDFVLQACCGNSPSFQTRQNTRLAKQITEAQRHMHQKMECRGGLRVSWDLSITHSNQLEANDKRVDKNDAAE